jgi:hypothetical protein
MKTNQKQRLLSLFGDGEWHGNDDLNRIAFRYTARLFDLRKDGYEFDEKHIGSHWFYRLKQKEYLFDMGVKHDRRSECV